MMFEYYNDDDDTICNVKRTISDQEQMLKHRKLVSNERVYGGPPTRQIATLMPPHLFIPFDKT